MEDYYFRHSRHPLENKDGLGWSYEPMRYK